MFANGALGREARGAGWYIDFERLTNHAAPDDAMKFQLEYRQASSQNAVQSVIAKYADLLAGSNRSPLIAMGFTPDGQISITSVGQTLS